MKKFPNIPLLMLAVAVLVVGYLFTRDGVQCRGRSLSPGQTCRLGPSTSTYEELASNPVRQFATYLLIAGAAAVIAVLVGLLRKPTRVFPQYRWPGRTPASTLLRLLGAAGAVMVVGALLSNQPATCGGQRLRPGDRCVNYDTGGSASYSDVSNAPITQLWIYLVIAAVLVIVAIVKLARRRPPTAEEVSAFEGSAAAVRQRLVGAGAAPDLLAQFEAEVEAERRKAGVTTN